MVESIKANGIMNPIIVRPLGKDQYEILSGHNRVKAAKEAGLPSIHAVIYNDLDDDDDAMLYVTDSNLLQRSSSDMAHSELANAIVLQYEAMKKKKGYRSDLVDAVDSDDRVPVAPRSRTAQELGDKYGLSSDTIKRYLRIYKLNDALKERLDHDEIAVRTAVSLSYLNKSEQEIVDQFLQANDDKKISMQQAEKLREESEKGELNQEAMEQILGQSSVKSKPLQFRREVFSKYFREDQTNDEIEKILAEALEMYMQKKLESTT
jgi:ParB family chromosome partitioning protein